MVFDINKLHPDAVILGAGDYPTHHIPLDTLDKAPFVCCCDSAAIEYIRRGGMPHAIVGDGDSLPEEMKQRYRDIWHQEDEQDDNDLTKATRHCLALGMKTIAYVGATGRREDHTLGNISHLAQFVRDFALTPIMLTDYGYFLAWRGKITISTTPRQQVSIFNLSASHIESNGLRWPTYAYSEWWEGTLNEAVGDKVELEADGVNLVYVTYDIK